MRDLNMKERRRKTRKVSVIVATALCLVSMFSIAMIYENTLKERKKAENQIKSEETEELGTAKDDNTDEDLVLRIKEQADSSIRREMSNDQSIKATEEPGNMVESSIASGEEHFNENSILTWPVQGSVLMGYSQDEPVYYETLEQYRYCNGMLIKSERGSIVQASADGVVEAVKYTDEYGWTVRVDIGDGYKVLYGQLTNIGVAEGDEIVSGANLGEVAVPTANFSLEGDNIYFEVTKDDIPVNPEDFLE